MENFVALLLMVIPGFFVRKIKEEIKSVKEIKSDTDKTIISLIYSVPVLIINLLVLVFLFNHTQLEQLIDLFKNLKFILKYALLTIFTTLAISLFLIFIEYKIKTHVVNFIRKKVGEPEKTGSITPWEDFFKKDQSQVPVKILKNDQILAQGFVKHWDLDGKGQRDLVLVHVDDMIKHENCFKEIKREYVDCKSGLVIQEFYFDEKNILDNLSN